MTSIRAMLNLHFDVRLLVSRLPAVRRLVSWRGRPVRGFGHVLLLLATATVPTQSAARCPDLALVLAIDGSGSMGPAEFQLQLQGYAAAFRSASVQQAIQSAGQVEVAVVLWADAEMASQVMPFRDVRSPQWAVKTLGQQAITPDLFVATKIPQPQLIRLF
jgi:hypothetical protein